MTTKESMKYLNKQAVVNYMGMTFYVQIEDVRERNGVKEFLVFPVNGDGSIWTSAIKFESEVV